MADPKWLVQIRPNEGFGATKRTLTLDSSLHACSLFAEKVIREC
jgi:hypothetical protein